MKKCRANEHEIEFAARVTPGELFAISETTHVPSLRRALLLQRHIHMHILHPADMTNEQHAKFRKHWAVYEAIKLTPNAPRPRVKDIA